MPPPTILHDHYTLKKHAATILQAIYPTPTAADEKTRNREQTLALMAFYGSRCMDEAVSSLYIGAGIDCVAHGLYHSGGSYNIPWESFPMAAMLVSTTVLRALLNAVTNVYYYS